MSNSLSSNTLSRRAFLTGAAAAGATLSLPIGRAHAASQAANGKRVAIFGSGMSGLVAAQELIEQGYSVDVYERLTQLGGKARSFGVPGSGKNGRLDLPAEHGFRFFPGFYENLIDSMQRVPIQGRKNGAADSLRTIDDLLDDDGFGSSFSFRSGASISLSVPLNAKKMQIADPGKLADPAFLAESVSNMIQIMADLPLDRLGPEMMDFTAKTLAYLTACSERKQGPWDQISWWQYLDADNKSKFFQDVIVKGLTMDLVAVKPEVCSVYSAGNILDAFTWNLLGVHSTPRTAYAIRFLDGPTSDVWLNPWIENLKRLGVRFHAGQALGNLKIVRGRITEASVIDRRGRVRRVEADWFLSAIPSDKVAPIITQRSFLNSDPALEGVKDLSVDWMNGLQIYLKRPIGPELAIGATLDHQWTLSMVAQSQLWKRSISQDFGDGTVQDVLSIDISTWDRPGKTTTTKSAKECSKQEVFNEIWTTLKQRFGKLLPAISDENLHSWYLDPAISWSQGTTGTVTNDETLSVQTVNTWHKRPTGGTAIPNFFLAGDWIRTNANVCCMEGGNEGGRMAVRDLLERSGGNRDRVNLWQIYSPPQLSKFKAIDKRRLDAGKPNLFEPAARQDPSSFGEILEGVFGLGGS